MDNTQNPLSTEEKLELIRSRAVRLGIRRHDLEDAIQEAMLELLEFRPDPDKTNGASESTILTTVIDRRLLKWLRDRNHHQEIVERSWAMLPSEDELLTHSSISASDSAMDVSAVLVNLSEFEQCVARMLSAGHSSYAIADELGAGRRAVNAAIEVIRERLGEAGLGGEVQE
ncbi:MAG: sigma-70 family RNA polymerase sigma factor [Planctomycetia bacterium]